MTIPNLSTTVGIVDLRGIGRLACILSQFSEKQRSQMRSKRILERSGMRVPRRIGHSARIALRHARAHWVSSAYAPFTYWQSLRSFSAIGSAMDLMATFDSREIQEYRYARPRDPSQPPTFNLQLHHVNRAITSIEELELEPRARTPENVPQTLAHI